jgi:hypothetical protein
LVVNNWKEGASMTNGSRKILRFRWLPVEGGIYTLAVDVPELTPEEQLEIDRIARKWGFFQNSNFIWTPPEPGEAIVAFRNDCSLAGFDTVFEEE